LPRRCDTRRRQRGWVGLLAILIVIAIVALLAGSVIRQYGLGEAPKRASPMSPASEAVGGLAPAAPDSASVPPRDALERARALEGTLKQQAADYEKRIDEQSK